MDVRFGLGKQVRGSAYLPTRTVKNRQEPSRTDKKPGNKLEGDVSDVIALDQLTSPFLLGKRQKCRLNFPQNTVFQNTFQYTHVSSAGV